MEGPVMTQANEMKAYPAVNSVIDIFANWLRHRREIAELCDCGKAEHANIARDLGVSVDQLDDLVRRGSHAAEELPKMMAALNLDAEAIARAQPLVMRDLQQVCSRCQSKWRCNLDLAAGTAAREHADYCSNTPTLDALAKQ
jgi:hypothetical protein